MRLFLASLMVLLALPASASSPPPLPPDGWDYSFNDEGEAVFKWNEPTFPAILTVGHYNLYVLLDGQPWDPIEVPAGQSTHNLGVPIDGATYAVFLRAVNGDGIEGAPTLAAVFKGGSDYPRCMVFAYALLPPSGPDVDLSPECVLPPP